MMKKKLLSTVLIGVMTVSLAAGCGNASSNASETNTGSAAGESATVAEGTLQSTISPDEEYIIVNCLNNIEYFNAHKYGWEKAGELFDVKVSFMGPANDDMNDMCTQLETAITKNPAGICVWGYDAALDPYIEKAQEAGIPIVTYVGSTEETGDTYIGTAQYDLGYEGGKQYAEMINGSGKVAILTITGSDMFEQRQEGFEDAFAEYPDIEVVAIGDTKADSETAISAAKDIAVKYQTDLTGFVCCDSTGTTGAATALNELGLTDEVDVLGLDRNTDTLELVKNGTITGTICQNDISMAYWALVCLITENHFDMPLSSDNQAAGVKVTPNTIYTSVNLVTSENVDYFMEENEVYATNGF